VHSPSSPLGGDLAFAFVPRLTSGVFGSGAHASPPHRARSAPAANPTQPRGLAPAMCTPCTSPVPGLHRMAAPARTPRPDRSNRQALIGVGPIALAQLPEPPDAEPLVRWCGGGRRGKPRTACAIPTDPSPDRHLGQHDHAMMHCSVGHPPSEAELSFLSSPASEPLDAGRQSPPSATPSVRLAPACRALCPATVS
jgi:hypothetical protein